MPEEKIVISHHCMSGIRNKKDGKIIWFDCREDDSGKFILADDQSFECVSPFCPFCGKESSAHAALIEQDTVRMVEHAI